MKKAEYPSNELELSSVIDNIPVAVDFVEKKIREAGLPDEEVANCCIAVSEAVANAIIHGNKLDENKKVVIRVRRGKNTLCVSVIDNGRGFNMSELQHPLSLENMQKEHGRGVFIMNALSDRVSYVFKENGTEVDIFKRIHNK